MEKMVEQNEKMVAANTVPFLTFQGGQLDPVTNKPLERLILKNGGVGPALIGWFELRYKGASYDRAREDLRPRACYCSVLDECWETDFGPERPKPVKECKPPAGSELW